MTSRTVHLLVADAAKTAGIEFPVHPNMLRHATCFYLAMTARTRVRFSFMSRAQEHSAHSPLYGIGVGPVPGILEVLIAGEEKFANGPPNA
jgi:hypothetical protein